jgi:hypothetical protein
MHVDFFFLWTSLSVFEMAFSLGSDPIIYLRLYAATFVNIIYDILSNYTYAKGL